MDSGSSDHVEVEWQFETADLAAARRWLEASVVPGYTVTPGATKTLNDTYFDTADWRVFRAGFTCRVRVKGGSTELTLKSMAAAAGGLRSRREISEPVPEGTGAASLRQQPGPCGELLRLVAGGHDLRPLFALHTRRETFQLADDGGELAEIALDDMSVVSGDDPGATALRVEVEVDESGLERARRFVDLTVAALGLTPALESKFQLAMAVAGLPPPTPEEAPFGPNRPSTTMTAAEAAFAVMRRQFEVFLANELGTRLGDDIEALHDMRVATRRLRAAMSAFRPYLSTRMERYRLQFGWVAAALGDVRDLDVQLERISEWRADFAPGQAQALDSLEAVLRERRTAARKRMLAALDSRRFASLTTRFAAMLQRGPAHGFPPGRTPVLAAAPDLMERRYRRVRKGGDTIRRDSLPPAYHALRIEAKKLRYALEFVGPLYGRPAIAFSERVTALQDVLGLHQDADVAITALHEIALANRRRLSAETLLVMGSVSERYRSDAVELRAKFPSVYRPLRGKAWSELRKLLEDRRPPSAPQVARTRPAEAPAEDPAPPVTG